MDANLDITPTVEKDDRKFWWLCFAILSVFHLAPIWLPRFLPLLDQPNHLASIQIWNHLADPAWGFQPFYKLNAVPVPYWGYYFPVHLLSKLFWIETANKIFLSLYVLSVPASVSVLAIALRRSPWLGLFVFPLAYNHSFAWGFLSYTPGMPLVLFGLATLIVYFRKPSTLNISLFFVILFVSWFMHILAWAALGAMACAYTITCARPFKRSIPVAVVMATSLLFAIWNTLYCAQKNTSVNPRMRFIARWESPREIFAQIPERILQRWNGGGVATATIAVLIATVAFLVYQGRNSKSEHVDRVERFFPEAAFAFLFFCYLLLPVKLVEPTWIWFVNTRYLALAFMFLPLFVRKRISFKIAMLPMFAASCIYACCVTRQYMAFNSRARGMVEVLRNIPRGASTLTLLVGSNEDPSLDKAYVPFNEFHSYPAVFSGGFNAYGWAIGFPFSAIKSLPSPPWTNVMKFNQHLHGKYYDYVLTRGEIRDHSLFYGYENRVHLVSKVDDWRLYATRGIE